MHQILWTRPELNAPLDRPKMLEHLQISAIPPIQPYWDPSTEAECLCSPTEPLSYESRKMRPTVTSSVLFTALTVNG
jgi:hypothetical protein